MAAQFSRRGIPALAVHGQVADEVRADAPRRRPITITWRLEYPMPAGLFEQYASLAN